MRTIEKIIQDKFDKFWLQFVGKVVFLGNRIFGKVTSAPNEPKMTLTSFFLDDLRFMIFSVSYCSVTSTVGSYV